jgi:hypothetical protein
MKATASLLLTLAAMALAVPVTPRSGTYAAQLTPVSPSNVGQTSLLQDVLSVTTPIDLPYQRPAQELASLRSIYERDRAACVWERSTAGHVRDPQTGSKPQAQTSMEARGFDANESIRMDQCSTATSFSPSRGSRWHIFRIGPMTSTGGYDWHTIASDDDPLSMRATLTDHGRMWITSFDMSPLDVNMSLLALPPIHIHHSHLGARWNSSKTGEAYPEHALSIGFSHGDTACTPDAGGPMCQQFIFPAGYGMRFEEPMGFDGLLNDVRDAGSVPMDFYYEVSIAFTTTPVQRPLGLLYTNTGVEPVVQKAHPDKQWFGTFEVPAAQESIVWSLMRYPHSARVFNFGLHTHTNFGYDGLWLVNGAPNDLGLALADWQHLEYPFRPNEHNLTTADFKEHVLRNMLANGLTFRCILAPHMVQLDADDPYYDNPRLMRPGLYGYQGDMRCYEGSDIIRAGEPITTIAFFSPRMNNPIPASSDPVTADTLYQQHIHHQSFVVFDETHPEWPQTDFWNANRSENGMQQFPCMVTCY